jgi:hypothetical protein
MPFPAPLVFALRSLLALAILTAFFVAGSALWALLGEGRRGPVALRWCGLLVGGFWWLTLSFHVLLALRRFDLAGAGLFLAATAFLAGWARRAGGQPGLTREAMLLRLYLRRVRRPHPLVLFLLAAFVVTGLRFLTTPSFAWDSLTYHLTKAGMWVQEGGAAPLVAPGGWDVYAHYYGGGEAVWAWSFLPFHGDLVAGFVDVAIWLWVALATYALGREMGLGAGRGMAAAAFMASVPAVFRAAGSNYVDNLTYAYVATALAFLVRLFRRAETRPLLLAGMAAGLAAGTKVTAVPIAGLLAGILLAWGAIGRSGGSRIWRWIAVAAVLGAAVFAPWPLNSYLATGNPFSKQPVRFLGVGFEGSPVLAWYAQLPMPTPYTWKPEARSLVLVFSGPISLGLFSVVPALLAPLGFWRYFRRQPWGAAVLAAVVFSLVALYWSSSFTVVRLLWAASNGRFFTLLVGLFTLLGFFAIGRATKPYALYLLSTAAFGFWHQTFSQLSSPEMGLLLASLTLIGLLGTLCYLHRGDPGWARGMLGATSLALFLWVGQTLRDAYRYAIPARTTVFHTVPPYWLPAAAALDRPGLAARVALTSGPDQRGDNWFMYPFLGSRLQNRIVYVPLSRSGEIFPANDPRYAATADREAWLARLEALKIDAVFSFEPASIEVKWMKQSPDRFTRVLGHGKSWGLFMVNKGSPGVAAESRPARLYSRHAPI